MTMVTSPAQAVKSTCFSTSMWVRPVLKRLVRPSPEISTVRD